MKLVYVTMFLTYASTLVGCVGAQDVTSEEMQGSPQKVGYGASVWEEKSEGPCANAVDVYVEEGPRGEVYIIEVPVACNQFWQDRGDPVLQLARVKQVYDPSPLEKTKENQKLE